MASPSTTENLVVIGSGPAGYTAALYAARANLAPLLVTGFQEGGIPGGQLMTTTHVENFPGFPQGILGPELMDRMKAQAVRWGTRLLETDADRLDLSRRPFTLHAQGQDLRTHAVILATGARANRLHLPGEERFWSRGISACAVCDGATPQFRHEPLAVVGGGDSACEEAHALTKYGSHVHLIVRRNRLRASRAMADRVLANNQITIHWQHEIVALQGDDWLAAIELRHRPDGGTTTLPVRGLFYAIGHTPNTGLVQGQLPLDGEGYLVPQRPGQPDTVIPGVFWAGDVADRRWRQAVTAAATGCQAALAAEGWLTEQNLAVPVSRQTPEPEPAPTPQPVSPATEETYSPTALWQQGSYALRRLYHESPDPLVVMYTAPGCGPCHVLKPQLRRVVEELAPRIHAVEINIEVEPHIARQAGVSGTPTTQVFSNKELRHQWRGVKQRRMIRAELEKVLSPGDEQR